MTARNQILLRGLVGLAAVWGAVFLIVKIAKVNKPTAEKVAAYQNENPLSKIEDSDERRRVVEKMADMLNQLEGTELAALAEREGEDPRRDFFRQMTEEEQRLFMERRVGRAFEQVMESFNEMEREERRRLVERALKRMEETGEGPGGGRLEETDPEIVEKLTEAGLKAYYEDASVETKIDLAPLMEEMQRTMGRSGGPRR
ncbi:MAG: hypothetical protein WD342_14915 [Verrucomicrobiales bacterium]